MGTKIFGDADSYYQIPDYQRPYSWEDEHIEQLWDDLSEPKNWTEKVRQEAGSLSKIVGVKEIHGSDLTKIIPNGIMPFSIIYLRKGAMKC